MNMKWPTFNLGNVCDLQNGFAFKSKTFKDSGTPVLRISSIQGEEVSDNRPVYIDENDYSENLSKYYVNQGDLLIAMSGATTGKIGFLKTNARYLLNQRVGLFRPAKNLDKQYLFYFLLTKSEESLRISAGSAQPNLSTRQIKDFQIPLPSLEEQKRIVAILDEAFAGIDTAIANTKKNLANARELFESYLNSVFSSLADNCDCEALSEVCQIKPPKREAKEQLSETDLVSFVPMNNLGIQKKSLILDKNKQLGKVVGSYTYFSDEDVLLAKITPCFENGKLGIARNLTNGVGFGSSEYIVFRSKGQVVSDYLYYFLSRASFREEGSKVMAGAVGHKRVPKEFIESYIMPLPTIEEQNLIVKKMDDLARNIQELQNIYQKKKSSLVELKQSLLQKAFSGELTAELDKPMDEAVAS